MPNHHTDCRHRIRESVTGSVQMHVVLRTPVRIPARLIKKPAADDVICGTRGHGTIFDDACTRVRFGQSSSDIQALCIARSRPIIVELFDHKGIHTEQIAMVGHCYSQLIERRTLNGIDQPFDLIFPETEPTLGVDVAEFSSHAHDGNRTCRI